MQIQISWLLKRPTDLNFTVCRAYTDSAGQGLSMQTKNKTYIGEQFVSVSPSLFYCLEAKQRKGWCIIIYVQNSHCD